MNGTFVVYESGVLPLADKPLDWPEDYRKGLAAGLLLDPDGSLTVSTHFVPALAAMIAEMSANDWSELSAQALSAPLPSVIANDADKLRATHDELARHLEVLPLHARPAWESLTARFTPVAAAS